MFTGFEFEDGNLCPICGINHCIHGIDWCFECRERCEAKNGRSDDAENDRV